jgi:hypothetical protein
MPRTTATKHLVGLVTIGMESNLELDVEVTLRSSGLHRFSQFQT